MAGHRADEKRYLSGKGAWCSSFEILAFGDAYIELVRVVEFTVKAELHAVEGELIRNNECVNKRQEGRTDAQYRADHVEEKKAYNAEYQTANAAKLRAKNTCPCGGCFTAANKAKHIKTVKHAAWLAEAAE